MDSINTKTPEDENRKGPFDKEPWEVIDRLIVYLEECWEDMLSFAKHDAKRKVVKMHGLVEYK